MLSAMPQGRDGQASIGSGLWLHPSVEEIFNHSCKYLSPLEAIKGEPRLTTKTGPSIHTTLDHHTPSEFSRRVASSTLSTAQSRDLGLSPLSQPAYTPLLQAPLGARQYRPPDLTLDVGHPWPEPV